MGPGSSICPNGPDGGANRGRSAGYRGKLGAIRVTDDIERDEQLPRQTAQLDPVRRVVREDTGDQQRVCRTTGFALGRQMAARLVGIVEPRATIIEHSDK